MNGKKLSSKSLEEWVKQASFVFRARVKALRQSNLVGVEPDERMATVRIEEVIIAPRDLGDLTGKIVTVYLQSVQGIRPGQLATFFARSWHYGETIGVVEVGRTTEGTAEVRQATIEERLRQLDEELEERIRGAQLIVSGRVLSTYRTERREGFPGIVEGVEWWEADLWVRTVEKGLPPPRLQIFFPVGGSPKWSPYPKAYPGQEGVWFLRPVVEAENGKTEESRQSKRKKKGRKQVKIEQPLMAHDPLDYHSISDLPRIQSLLWRAAKE
jgi:hypothetical protein